MFSRLKCLLVLAMTLLMWNSCATHEFLLPAEDVVMSPELLLRSGFTCKPAPIVSQSFRDNVHFHLIVGSDHAAAASLLTHRLCFAIQMGINVRPIIGSSLSYSQF